ncbi:hypothetical protein ABH14_18500 [Brevibacillus brevis]|nr:hypothetical protein [Brevibacillus brevis]
MSDNNFRNNFIDYYEKNYGLAQHFAWDEVSIHHMIPLEYYGSNDMSKLIPLLRYPNSNSNILYHDDVTDWWRSYRRN